MPNSDHIGQSRSTTVNMRNNGASGSAAHDTGEFTDEEDTGIPLEDIREVEFERLEAVAPSREAVRMPRRNQSWLPWKRSKQRKPELGNYLPVEEEDQAQLLRKQPRNRPLATAEVVESVKEFSCDSKLGWGILYLRPLASLT